MDDTAWMTALSPWPEEFGLDRMRRLLADLGDPQRRFPSVHVVGTNGKTLDDAHDRRPSASFGEASRRVRLAACSRLGGAHPGRRGRRGPRRRARPGAAVRGGRNAVRGADGRRLRRVRRARGRCCRDRGGPRRPARRDERARRPGRGAHERLARAHGGARRHARGDRRGEARGRLARRPCRPRRAGMGAAGARRRRRVGRDHERLEPRRGGCRRRSSSSSGPSRPRRPRLSACRGDSSGAASRPLEIWDGAHNLAGIGYLLPRLPARPYTIVASILGDKDAEAMLRALSALGSTFVATASENPRALPAGELARIAEPIFDRVEAIAAAAGGARACPRARGAGRRRTCDRIALLARGAIARCVEPVPFLGPVDARACICSQRLSSACTSGLRSLPAGS